ncbi:hypothetical protein BLNAU_21305 [Blattamonas nauphoetae]|uniref:PHD-type domain-containing protein n=1 Tax=Blattamonas nauphoetae TaxID=2049346 RepID=A0ABQ9WYI9_9EUKA|nr:hypothetical protein BLNAU_21305 [Blattamonas nauphoetae]
MNIKIFHMTKEFKTCISLSCEPSKSNTNTKLPNIYFLLKYIGIGTFPLFLFMTSTRFRDECQICGKSHTTITCPECKRRYHSYCLGFEIPSKGWVCVYCESERDNKPDSQTPPKPQKRPIQRSEKQQPKKRSVPSQSPPSVSPSKKSRTSTTRSTRSTRTLTPAFYSAFESDFESSSDDDGSDQEEESWKGSQESSSRSEAIDEGVSEHSDSIEPEESDDQRDNSEALIAWRKAQEAKRKTQTQRVTQSRAVPTLNPKILRDDDDNQPQPSFRQARPKTRKYTPQIKIPNGQRQPAPISPQQLQQQITRSSIGPSLQHPERSPLFHQLLDSASERQFHTQQGEFRVETAKTCFGITHDDKILSPEDLLKARRIIRLIAPYVSFSLVHRNYENRGEGA